MKRSVIAATVLGWGHSKYGQVERLYVSGGNIGTSEGSVKSIEAQEDGSLEVQTFDQPDTRVVYPPRQVLSYVILHYET